VLDRAVQASTSLPEPEACTDLSRLADAAVRPDDPSLRETAAELRERVAQARALKIAGRYVDAAVAIEALGAAVDALAWPPLVAELRETRGMIAMSRGDAAAAEVDLRAAHLAAVEGRHDHVAWSAATGLAHALAELPGRIDEARRACDLAQAQWARAGLGDRFAAIVEGARFRVEAAAGDYAAARVHIERSIALREREGQTEDADLAGALANYGAIVGLLGRPDLAVESLRRAIAIRERVQAPGHPEVGRDLHNLGAMLAQQGAYEDAGPLLERALDIKREALGGEHPDLAYTLVALGNVALAGGDLAAAERRFRAALEIVERAHGPDHPDAAFALLGLGDRYLHDARPAEALPPLRRALAIREAAQGPDHPEVAYVRRAYGVALLDSGDPAGAVAQLARARKIVDALPEPVEHADVDWPLARARWQLGADQPAAIALAQAARRAYQDASPPRADAVAAIDAWLAERTR
jgi:eukaryotic-like serine/threonine-protein kinase